MANLWEPSPSMSFTSPSSILSDSTQPIQSLEAVSLNKLSCNLGHLLLESKQFNFADVEIEVEGSVYHVHRCLLAARSMFFHELFKGGDGTNSLKPRYSMKDLLPFGHIGCDVFREFLWYLYTGKLRQVDPDISTCVDDNCMHDACRPAINFVVELMYASYCFNITELVSLLQRRLLNFVNKVFMEEVIPILLVAFHTSHTQLIEHCIHKLACSDLDDTFVVKELPQGLSDKIRDLRLQLQSSSDESVDAPANSFGEKGIKRVYKALDSDDVELVKMLLKESDITLDDANALHYAAAYCDSKIVAEVMELGTNVNLKNARGYTPLHLAAKRMEPAVILELIRRGASIVTPTEDGRNAIGICRKLTRRKDYNAKKETCKESNKNRICIDILEQEQQLPTVGEESVESLPSPEDLQMQADDLEIRVAFARLVFPAEAKLAMKIAETATKKLDLNETPLQQLQARINKLEKTVKLGRHYFPHCSEWLDKFIGDDRVYELCDSEQGGPNQQELKQRRFNEIRKDLLEAFSKDMTRKDAKADRSLSKHSSSFSSSSPFNDNR